MHYLWLFIAIIAETIGTTALQASQQLSAWSLIVSFLGDAIGPGGGVVSASTLQTLMQRLGIGHGAVRTAVSRLAAEGWIERSREGRNSFYALSGDVGETILRAERRIYAASSLLPADTPRSLLIAADPLPDTTLRDLEAAGALQIAVIHAGQHGHADDFRIFACSSLGVFHHRAAT